MATLKRCLGVDLGSSSVKIVELAVDKTEVKIVRAVQAETLVEPMAPVEERRAAIIKVLRETLKKNRIATKDAVFGLPGQKVFVRRFRLPQTTDERLERIVLYEARQQIPFPLDKTDLQYQFFPLPDSNEVEVLLVAVRRDEVSDFMGLVSKSGLTPVDIGVSSFALFSAQAFIGMDQAKLRAFVEERLGKAKKPKKAGKGKAVEAASPEGTADNTEEVVYEEVKGYVNIGATSLDLVVSRSGKQTLMGFVRTVPAAGNDMTRSIMEKCQIGSFLDAERVKKHSARLMTFDFDFDAEGDTNRDACTAATQTADRIVAEIRRSLDFFITQPDGMAVDALVISGGQGLLPGMDTYLEEKLTIPTSVLRELPEGSGLAWPEAGSPVAPFMPAIGLALQGLGLSALKVDFLPGEKKIIRDFPYRVVAVMAGLVGATVLVGSQAGARYANEFETLRQRLDSELRSQEEQYKLWSAVQLSHEEVAGYYAKFSDALGQRAYWSDFMAELAARKPPEVLLNEVHMGHDGAVEIVALSETQRSGPDFVNELIKMLKDAKVQPNLKNIEPLARYPGFPGQVYRITISFQTGDKVNHLRVTPTPATGAAATPAPVAAPRRTPRR